MADKAVFDVLSQARSNYQVLVQQCARNPEQYEQCLQDTLKICQRLKTQLLQAESSLAQRLNKPLESYYADLVCACRCGSCVRCLVLVAVHRQPGSHTNHQGAVHGLFRN